MAPSKDEKPVRKLVKKGSMSVKGTKKLAMGTSAEEGNSVKARELPVYGE